MTGSAKISTAIVVVAVLLGGCGGAPPGTGRRTDPPDATSPPPRATPTAAGVRVRVVNLYLPEDGPQSVDIVPGIIFPHPESVLPVHTVALGDSTEYFTPPVDNGGWVAFSFFATGERDLDSKLFDAHEEMAPGTQRTIVLSRVADPSSESGLATQQFNDLAGGADPKSDWPAPKPGMAQIVGIGVVNDVLGAEDNSFRYGSPGKGCLAPSDTETGTSTWAARAASRTTSNPAPSRSPPTARGMWTAPVNRVIAPVQVTAAPGSRTYVLVWTRTETPDGRELMVLPVAETAKTGPTTTTPPPASAAATATP